ncbi:MAG: 5-(carboxyamino)imidazole ribonucleotide mutase [Treponema sp.]
MKVGVIMGSSSDKDIAQKAVEVLKDFGVGYEIRVISAHRSLDLAIDFVKSMEEKSIELIIAFAGKAAHLAGVLAGLSVTPVIGVPVKASTLDGLDALLSTVQMPKGVPVATVAIDGAENAALLAVQILSLKYPELKTKLQVYKESLKETVKEMDRSLGCL